MTHTGYGLRFLPTQLRMFVTQIAAKRSTCMAPEGLINRMLIYGGRFKGYIFFQACLKKDTTCSSQSRFISAASDTISEMGIQFRVADAKRHEALLKYWVKG